MKTSNKILIVTIVLWASLVYALPISINLKYNQGDYSVINDGTTYVNLKLPAGKVVSIKNLNKCLIVSSDSFRITVAEYHKKLIRLHSVSDTLNISFEKLDHSDSTKVILYLPTEHVQKIIVSESFVELKGAPYSLRNPKSQDTNRYSFTLDLHRSHLSLMTKEAHQFFSRLVVNATDSSTLVISARNHVMDLNLYNIRSAKISPLAEIAKTNIDFNPKAAVNLSRNEGGIIINSVP